MQCNKHGGDCEADRCCDTDYAKLVAEVERLRTALLAILDDATGDLNNPGKRIHALRPEHYRKAKAAIESRDYVIECDCETCDSRLEGNTEECVAMSLVNKTTIWCEHCNAPVVAEISLGLNDGQEYEIRTCTIYNTRSPITVSIEDDYAYPTDSLENEFMFNYPAEIA
jgi:hypothetical protein